MLKLAIAIGLGAAAWYWRKDIASLLEQQFPGIGEKTARTLSGAEESAERFYGQARSRVGGV